MILGTIQWKNLFNRKSRRYDVLMQVHFLYILQMNNFMFFIHSLDYFNFFFIRFNLFKHRIDRNSNNDENDSNINQFNNLDVNAPI